MMISSPALTLLRPQLLRDQVDAFGGAADEDDFVRGCAR